MITAESLTLMGNFDVTFTSCTFSEGGVTKVTLESLTLMDTSDVMITSWIFTEGGGVTFIAALYF